MSALPRNDLTCKPKSHHTLAHTLANTNTQHTHTAIARHITRRTAYIFQIKRRHHRGLYILQSAEKEAQRAPQKVTNNDPDHRRLDSTAAPETTHTHRITIIAIQSSRHASRQDDDDTTRRGNATAERIFKRSSTIGKCSYQLLYPATSLRNPESKPPQMIVAIV